MSATAFYKRYPADFVHGVIGLGAAEIGAYSIILDLIYDRRGAIPNDSKWIGGILGEHPRRTRALIDHLISAGKLFEVDGKLHNKRAERSLKDYEKAGERRAKDASHAAHSRWQREKDQALSDADSIPSRARESRNQKPEEKEGSLRSPKKGTRLPDDWQLPLDDEAWALEQGLTRSEVAGIAVRFRNYWTAKSGSQATKLNWPRTWQNWVLKELENRRLRNGHGREPRHTMSDVAKELADHARERSGYTGEALRVLPRTRYEQ